MATTAPRRQAPRVDPAAATRFARRSTAWARDRPGPVALFGVLVAAFVLRAWLGLEEMGMYWPDEVRQSIEPAHRLVFGYGHLPWEYIEGARSWAFPGLLAGFLWPVQAVGLDAPDQYLSAIRVLFILVSVATAAGIAALVRVLGGSWWAAAAGAAVFGLAAPLAYFGHRAMSEVASALPVVAGFALALAGSQLWELDRTRARRLLLAGAALIGFAVLLRLQVAVLCVGLVVLLAARRQWRAALEATAVLLAFAVALGVLDELTYGRFFASARRYIEFNLIDGGAEGFGVQPFDWYLEVLWRSMPLVVLLVAAGLLGVLRRAPGLVLVAAGFLLLHFWTAHKELRFILPVLPIVIALGAVGLEQLVRHFDTRAAPFAALALGVAALASGMSAPALDFRDVGAYETTRPDNSAWNDVEDVNRLLLAAHEQPDLCGIKLETSSTTFSGGLSHLHRDVAYVAFEGPPRESGAYNYVIGLPPGEGDPTPVIATWGGLALLRIRSDCPAPRPPAPL